MYFPHSKTPKNNPSFQHSRIYQIFILLQFSLTLIILIFLLKDIKKNYKNFIIEILEAFVSFSTVLDIGIRFYVNPKYFKKSIFGFLEIFLFFSIIFVYGYFFVKGFGFDSEFFELFFLFFRYFFLILRFWIFFNKSRKSLYRLKTDTKIIIKDFRYAFDFGESKKEKEYLEN